MNPVPTNLGEPISMPPNHRYLILSSETLLGRILLHSQRQHILLVVGGGSGVLADMRGRNGVLCDAEEGC